MIRYTDLYTGKHGFLLVTFDIRKKGSWNDFGVFFDSGGKCYEYHNTPEDWDINKQSLYEYLRNKQYYE